MLNRPFYDNQTGNIEKTNSFSSRLNGLGRRAGYPNPPMIHDFRAEGLHLIGKLIESPTSSTSFFHRCIGCLSQASIPQILQLNLNNSFQNEVADRKFLCFKSRYCFSINESMHITFSNESELVRISYGT